MKPNRRYRRRGLGAFEDFARAFEAFKDTNDTRLGEIETRLSGDVVTDEKLTRIDAALDDAKRRLDRFALDRSRPPLGRGDARARSGAEPSTRPPSTPISAPARPPGLKRLEEKALSAGSGPDGGYLVPPKRRDARSLRRLAAISPIRAIVVGAGDFRRPLQAPFSTTGPATGWVGETAARPQTARRRSPS